MIDSTYEDKLYQTPTFAGAFRYNTLRNCATRVCRACLDEITCVAVIYLTLRICLGMGAHCAPYGRKNPLPFPCFAAVTCRQSVPSYLRERGNSQEGGNRRCLPSCAPARRQRTPPAAGRGESPRSAERNSPLRFSEKLPARKGRTRLRSSRTPLSRCRKRAAPSGRTRLRGSCPPQNRCKEKTQRKPSAFRIKAI